MTKEQAIRILSSDTSMEEIHKLKYYAGFNQDRVLEQIQEAMDMGADALRKLGEWMQQGKLEVNDGYVLMDIYKKFDMTGHLLPGECLSSKELVLIFSIAKGIKEGKIVSK